MSDTVMLNDQQIEHILKVVTDRLSQKERDSEPVGFGIARRDKTWMLRLGVGHTISVLVLVSATLFGFGWSMNNRMTAVEINQNYTHDSLVEIKHDVVEIKRDVQNLSSRLETTRRPIAPEGK